MATLKEAFGQWIATPSDSAGALWKQMRLAQRSLADILHCLAQTHKRSLLGDYQCLRPPD